MNAYKFQNVQTSHPSLPPSLLASRPPSYLLLVRPLRPNKASLPLGLPLLALLRRGLLLVPVHPDKGGREREEGGGRTWEGEGGVREMKEDEVEG